MTGLPGGWRLMTVGEAGRLQLGRQRAPRYHSGANLKPYLRVANVFEDHIDLSDLKSMHFDSDEFERYRLHDGDVLLNEGQTPELLGRPAIYREHHGELAFTNSLIRFQACAGVDPRWALAVFRHHMHAGRFKRESRITTNIAHLSLGRLRDVEFPVPPLDEQHRIVTVLEDHLSRLDAADAATASATRRLSALRERSILDAVTGTGDATRSPAKLAPVGTHDGDLPDLPLGWEWARLGEVADVVGGVTKDAKKQGDPAFVDVPYLRVANVQRGHLKLDNVTSIRVAPTKATALALQPGDVLLNEGGDRDKLARGWVWEGQIKHCIHQNHVFRARIHEPRLDPYLLSWTTNTLGARWAERNGKQSVNLASISLTMIRKMPVIVPPAGVASAVVAQLHEQLASFDRLEVATTTSRTRSAALRRRLLAAAFSGRLTEAATSIPGVEEMMPA